MFRTQPEPLPRRAGPAAWIPYTAERKFTRRYFSKPLSRVSSTPARNGAAPALLTRMSSVPNDSTVRSTAARTASGSPTSASTAIGVGPPEATSSAVSSSASRDRATSTRFAPARPNATAIARPIPHLSTPAALRAGGPLQKAGAGGGSEVHVPAVRHAGRRLLLLWLLGHDGLGRKDQRRDGVGEALALPGPALTVDATQTDHGADFGSLLGDPHLGRRPRGRSVARRARRARPR